MNFGIFSNDRRPARTLGEAWEYDTDEIAHADRLGMAEAWMSEHEASADMLIARASGATKQIRLGSGVRVLPFYHPLQVAVDAGAADQLTRGRYILGVGPGFSKARVAQRGADPAEMREMTNESIELIQRLFRSPEPFDFDGTFWRGQDLSIGIDWVNGAPEIALSVAGSPESAYSAGQRGLGLLTPDFASNEKLRGLGEALVQGQESAGLASSRNNMRVTRVIYVADTDKEARDAMRVSYNGVIEWELANTPWHQADRVPPGGTMDDITFDYLVDSGNLLVGAPNTVREMVEALFAEVGGFGTLLFHAGRDYATHEGMKNSMSMFVADVVPKLQHLQCDELAPSIPARS